MSDITNEQSIWDGLTETQQALLVLIADREEAGTNFIYSTSGGRKFLAHLEEHDEAALQSLRVNGLFFDKGIPPATTSLGRAVAKVGKSKQL